MAMRIFTEQALKEFSDMDPSSRTSLQVWSRIVKNCDWKRFSDMKRVFNAVECIGPQTYVFNLKGDEFRLVAHVSFTTGFVYVRFIGTCKEYDGLYKRSVRR